MAEEAKRHLALAAAHACSEAATELLRYAREGSWHRGEFDPTTEPLEKLCDATKMTAEILADEPDPDGNRNQLLGALTKFLEGWA